jgi:ProP effector
MDRNHHQKVRILETLKWLQEKFPQTFSKPFVADDEKMFRTPLKIGILEEIFKTLPEDGSMPRTAVRETIKFYTKGFQYHMSILKQTHRIDLEGNPSSLITEEERKHSAECLKAIKKYQAHRNQKRD